MRTVGSNPTHFLLMDLCSGDVLANFPEGSRDNRGLDFGSPRFPLINLLKLSDS